MQNLKFNFQDLNKSYFGIKSFYEILESSNDGSINHVKNKFENKSIVVFDTDLKDQKLLTSNFYLDVTCHGISASPLEIFSSRCNVSSSCLFKVNTPAAAMDVAGFLFSEVSHEFICSKVKFVAHHVKLALLITSWYALSLTVLETDLGTE